MDPHMSVVDIFSVSKASDQTQNFGARISHQTRQEDNRGLHCLDKDICRFAFRTTAPPNAKHRGDCKQACQVQR